CTLDEIPQEDRTEIEAKGWKIEPMTPELFSSAGDKNPLKPASTSSRATGEKSTVESPTKLVWEIASSLPAGSSKIEIIDACLARGITKATAQTQYYKWAKAQKG